MSCLLNLKLETLPFLDFLVISHVLAAECDRHKLLITLKAQLCIWQLTVAVVDEYHTFTDLISTI